MPDGSFDHSQPTTVDAERPVMPALINGALRRCPNCNKGRMFRGYLKVRDACDVCGTEFYHHRADDAPPYFTILITGHVVVPLMATFLATTDWPVWLHSVVWVSLAMAMMLSLLPRIKGALIALQWALRMHGFEFAAETTAPTAQLDRIKSSA